MKHAFVIPAYGDSPYLRECVRSLQRQVPAAGSEIVITTSTPSAGIAAAASELGVPLRINPHRGGIGSDWNFALDATDAEQVTLAHQDDLYDPAYVAVMVAAIASRPDALIAFSGYREITRHGPRAANLNLRVKQMLHEAAFAGRQALTSAGARRRLLAFGNPVCCPSVVFNRPALGGWRFSETLRSNLDWDAWLRLAAQPGAFVYVRQPLVVRRIHPDSETSAVIADDRRAVEDLAMLERFWPAPVAALVARAYRLGYRANRD